MKRIVSVLLALLTLFSCVPALAAGAQLQSPESMPQAVRDFFSAATFQGYTIGEHAFARVENTVGGQDYSFAVAQKDGLNVLYGFQGKQHTYYLRADNCLPQGAGEFALNHVSSGDVDILEIDFTPQAGGSAVYMQYTVNRNGQWHLTVLSVHGEKQDTNCTVSSDQVYYYTSQGDAIGTAYGVVETNLRYFSFSAFPRTLKEAREKLSNPPSIPAGELKAKNVKFTGGQKFEVYSGPGAEYERAANGRAVVSTNDWIQVFGAENGHILIQYDISSSQMRFGYISQTALPSGANVSALQFDYADAEITAATYLTDDPLNSRTRTRTLSSGQPGVKWLAAMGSWVYVEVTGSGQPIRGFVPASAIRKITVRNFSAAYYGSAYSASAAVSVENGTASIRVTVDGPSAWGSSGADRILGYQIYSNNALVAPAFQTVEQQPSSAWRQVFVYQVSLPAGAAVLGLCPLYAGGSHAGETITVYLGQ